MKDAAKAILAYFAGGWYLSVAEPGFVEIAKTWGLFAAITVYFIWQSWRREKELNTKINAMEAKQDLLEKEIRDRVLTVIAKNTSVLEAVSRKLGES